MPVHGAKYACELSPLHCRFQLGSATVEFILLLSGECGGAGACGTEGGGVCVCQLRPLSW